MRRRNSCSPQLLVLWMTIGALCPGASALALTLTVNNTIACDDTDGDPAYCTIQAAVNAAAALDTIAVAAGTYVERVTVNKTLTLAGAQFGVDARTRSG